ncbi:hypothetical protein U1Q18_015248 [Sarracenia purpurea var. burkii]
MVRLDMSEYMQKHSVSKLFSSPPGYIGCDDGGQLTEAMLDDGILADSKERTLDFKNTIIVMTSNIGGGLTATGESSDKVKRQVAAEIKKAFRGVLEPVG